MLNPLQNATMSNFKAREALLKLKQTASRLECESVSIGGCYLYITPEHWEDYKDHVKKLIRTYNRFIKALYDDGVE